jgi:hypothetical protein
MLGCYTQPVIPPDKPLSCSNADASGECPKGFACIDRRVCAPTSCEDDSHCPAGLVCTGRGCVLPTTDSAIPPFTTPGVFLDGAANRPGDDAAVDASIAGGPDASASPDAGGGN